MVILYNADVRCSGLLQTIRHWRFSIGQCPRNSTANSEVQPSGRKSSVSNNYTNAGKPLETRRDSAAIPVARYCRKRNKVNLIPLLKKNKSKYFLKTYFSKFPFLLFACYLETFCLLKTCFKK